MDSSTRSASPKASIGVLGRAVGRGEGHRDAPADGGEEDDAPVRGAQRGQQRLRDGDLPEHVDVELRAQVVGVNQLKRAAVADAGVVDERVEAPGRRRHRHRPVAQLGDAPGRFLDLLEVGDVENQRQHAPGGRFAGEPRAGLVVAHAGEHRPAGFRQAQRGRLADSGGGSGDECGGHA